MSAIDPKDASKVRTAIRYLGKGRSGDVHKGMWAMAEILLKEARNLVPVETGALYRSGRIRVDATGLNIMAYVIFGGSGYDIDYAWIVHENLMAAHGEAFNIKHAAEIARGKEHPRRPQEQAKFLEVAARTKTRGMRDALKLFIGKSTNK